MRPISRLQFITTNAVTAEHACKAGIDWIQVRVKDVSYEEYRNVAKEVQDVCKQYNATFIVNDSIKLALEINADGVHVGKDDPLPQGDIDEMLARGGIIGCTVNTVDDFIHLSGKAVSYVGCGPYQYTTTKQKLSPILGLTGYQELFSELKEKGIAHPPVIGIGGIRTGDVSGLMRTGLFGIAVSGAIANAPDVAIAVKEFRMAIFNKEQEYVRL